MRKITLYLLSAAIIAVGLIMIPNSERAVEASAKAEIAMELTTETIITEKNADSKLPMASTTKIVTAIIIIEDCSLDEIITVHDSAVGVEGSSIYLKKDEKISIKDLLYGLMLRSGNDSAVALAIHHSGSTEKFAEVMTQRAKAMGAENSEFKNPSGLPDDNHYTTAKDLCKIACHAMKNPVFKEIVSTTNYKGQFRSFVNKNKILKSYEGANGVKTGYTLKAGRCLVSSAEQNGMDIVCVVLNCPEMYERSCEIFDYGFKNYKLLKLDENKVFMCNNVLCKLKNTENLVIKISGEITYSIKPLSESNDNAIAELEIYRENNLLFTRKLYSILDD